MNHSKGEGVISQMSLAYSWMVRSLLNVYDPAVFIIDIFTQFCNKGVSYKNVSKSDARNGPAEAKRTSHYTKKVRVCYRRTKHG